MSIQEQAIMRISFADESHTLSTRKLNYNARTLMTLETRSYIVFGQMETSSLDCHILIGKYCSLSWDLRFPIAIDHHTDYAITYPLESIGAVVRYMHMKSVQSTKTQNSIRGGQIVIGNDVWLGRGVTVLGGVRIGNGAVVGANAVVAKDIPPYAVAVGNPARVIKYRFDAETIARLQRIRWWDWEEKTIRARYEEMKDAPRFARKYDLPLPTLVGQWPELGEAKRDGLKIYGFIPDFSNETERVWEHVLQMYMQDVSSDDPVLLVLFLENGQPNAQQLRLLENWIRARGERAPRLLAYDPQGARDFSFMREVDAFITTKEAITTSALDALEAYGNSGAQVLYGMDADIFVQK